MSRRTLRATAAGLGVVMAVVAGALAGCNPPPEPPTTTLVSWSPEAAAPEVRFEANGAAVEGRLYVFGGYLDVDLTETTRSDLYDPSTGSWRRLTDMPVPVTHAAVAVDGNSIWLVGGRVAGHHATPSSEVLRYDIEENQWTQGPSLPSPRSAGGAAVVGEELHYFAGTSAAGDADEHWAFDLAQPGEWEARAPMPIPRNHIGTAVVDGAIYAIGGQIGSNQAWGNRPEVHRYDPGGDTWTRRADLPAGRGHIASSTFVADGRIVVAGGKTNAQRATRSVVAYDPAANVWVKLPSLPAARYSAVVDLLDDRIVATAGHDGDGPTATTWSAVLAGRREVSEQMPAPLGEVASGVIGRTLFVLGEGSGTTRAYDLATGAWTTRAGRPFPGHHHAAEVYQGRLYLFGGLGGAAGKVQIYDPVADSWRLGADMPFAAGSSSSAVIGDRVYVAGGIVNGATTTQAASYAPALDQWAPMAPMPHGRNHAASGTGGFRMWVFGGRGPGSGDNNSVANGFDTVQAYNPGTDTWQSSADHTSPLRPLPQARGGMGKAVFHDGRYYVMGGETADGAGATSKDVYRRVDVYWPGTNTWTEATPMPTARHGIFPVVVGGRIYVAGGGTQAGFSSSRALEVYNPAP